MGVNLNYSRIRLPSEERLLLPKHEVPDRSGSSLCKAPRINVLPCPENSPDRQPLVPKQPSHRPSSHTRRHHLLCLFPVKEPSTRSREYFEPAPCSPSAASWPKPLSSLLQTPGVTPGCPLCLPLGTIKIVSRWRAGTRRKSRKIPCMNSVQRRALGRSIGGTIHSRVTVTVFPQFLPHSPAERSSNDLWLPLHNCFFHRFGRYPNQLFYELISGV